MNIFFSKCFNQSVPQLSKGDDDALPQMLNPNDFPPEFLCTEENICELLESLDVSKSNGPDGISTRMLKYTAASIAPSIARLFNQSLLSCRVPSEWKIGV